MNLSSLLTSVTAKLLFPHGTTLYHLSCRTSMKPWDLYWLISSEMFEVRGELGGRPIPYPRRKTSTIISLLLVGFLVKYVHFSYQLLAWVIKLAFCFSQPVQTWMLVYHGLRTLRWHFLLCITSYPNTNRICKFKIIKATKVICKTRRSIPIRAVLL